jgi:hypothetical protein
MTSTLKIDQAALFAALDHNKHAMATVLALLEVMGHERVEVNFGHAFNNCDVAFDRDQILKALGADQ